MPIYSYFCSNCKGTSEEYRQLADRLNTATCPNCGSVAMFVLTFSARQGPSYPYMDTNMDHKPVEITSLKQRNRELKKRGLQDCGVRRGNPGSWI
jgi:putative FmdB family regulatory protein